MGGAETVPLTPQGTQSGSYKQADGRIASAPGRMGRRNDLSAAANLPAGRAAVALAEAGAKAEAGRPAPQQRAPDES